jgi:hypothetical protein
VWRRLGYQWVDAEMIEQWIQYVQKRRKCLPSFEFNDKHYRLLWVLLEEVQNYKSAAVEWTEPKIKTLTVSYNNSYI